MHLQPVGIYYLGLAAYGREIKTILAFLDEVFHLASSAIEPDHLIRFGFHVGDDEGIHEAISGAEMRNRLEKHGILEIFIKKIQEYRDNKLINRVIYDLDI